MKKIKITEFEFNSIHPHTNKASLKVFALFAGTEGLTMQIKNIDGTMNWLEGIIKKLPHTVSKDVITVLDKVFFIKREILEEKWRKKDNASFKRWAKRSLSIENMKKNWNKKNKNK